MVGFVVLVVEGAIALAAVLVAVAFHVRNSRTAVHARVLVNLLGGSAFDAVLWARRGRYLVLRDAKLIEPGTKAVPVDGEVLIDRDRVDFVQARYGTQG